MADEKNKETKKTPARRIFIRRPKPVEEPKSPRVIVDEARQDV